LPHDQKLVAIVDDDEGVLRAVARLLRACGYAVESFAGGAEFLESSLTPDCLLLDLYMPGTNGANVLAQLAMRGRRIPAVVITGSGYDGTEWQVEPAHTVPVLQKPIDDQALLDAVAAAIAAGKK
jgi:FixJ family two-component response regulator